MSTQPGNNSSSTRTLDFDQVWSEFRASNKVISLEQHIEVPSGRTLELLHYANIDLNGKSVKSTGTGTITTTAGEGPPQDTVLDSAAAQKTSVKLLWHNGSAAGHYLVQYGPSSGNYTKFIVRPKTESSYTVTGLTNGARYYFKVNNPGQLSNTPSSCRSDYDGDGGTIDFDDFFIWADHYGISVTADSLQKYDLSGNAVVDSTSDLYRYLTPDLTKNCSAIPKLIALASGINGNAEPMTKMDIGVGEVMFDVEVENVSHMRGYGLTIKYDPEKFAFLGIADANGILRQRGEGTFVGFVKERRGEVMMAGVLKREHAGLGGSGHLARARFAVLNDSEGSTSISLDHLVLLDDDRRTNVLIVDSKAPSRPTASDALMVSPNPFNPKTNIEVNLDRVMEIELHLYDAIGQRIRTLVGSEMRLAGRHVFEWDGRNDNGGVAASGTYFIQLRAGAEMYNTRVTLLR